MIEKEEIENKKQSVTNRINYEKGNINNLDKICTLLSQLMIYDVASKNKVFKTEILSEKNFKKIENDIFSQKQRMSEIEIKENLFKDIAKDIRNQKNLKVLDSIIEGLVSINCAKFQMGFFKKREEAIQLNDADSLKTINKLSDFDFFKKVSAITNTYSDRIRSNINRIQNSRDIESKNL